MAGNLLVLFSWHLLCNSFNLRYYNFICVISTYIDTQSFISFPNTGTNFVNTTKKKGEGERMRKNLSGWRKCSYIWQDAVVLL